MHYFGTYCLARAAGIPRKNAHIIASAAQYVDDAAQQLNLDFQDGAMLVAKATAHHMLDIKNIEKRDQRQVWVPFHFLPGNEGESFTEKLLCRKDSEVAKKMLAVNLNKALECKYGDTLIGISAHVYADTFAHYDFSGVSSRSNRANDLMTLNLDSETDAKIIEHVESKRKMFFKLNGFQGGLLANIKGFLGKNLSGALGHGAAATYPDRPYLKWKLNWDSPNGRNSERDNPQTFLEACENLHNFFSEYAEKSSFESSKRMKFNDFKDSLCKILAKKAEKEDRIKEWKRASRNGIFCNKGESIPTYLGDKWSEDFTKLVFKRNSIDATDSSVVHFYQASAFHRVHILRDLLPSLGLIVG